jgi:hypothetical protein
MSPGHGAAQGQWKQGAFPTCIISHLQEKNNFISEKTKFFLVQTSQLTM